MEKVKEIRGVIECWWCRQPFQPKRKNNTKFCSRQHCQLWHSWDRVQNKKDREMRKRYRILNKNKEKARFKRWYEKNKERQKENVYRRRRELLLPRD